MTKSKGFDRVPCIAVPDGYEPESAAVVIGGHEVVVYKMSLGSFARAVNEIEPYLKELAALLFGTAAFQKVMAGEVVDPKIIETEVKTAVINKLAEMIAAVPETVVRLLACIMNIPADGEAADFFWNAVGPNDLLDVIEKLDELNNFAEIVNRLIGVIGYLGKRYGIKIPGVAVVEKKPEVEETEEN